MDGEQWLNFREHMRFFRMAQGIENLEKIREYRKVSKRKFADQLGISRSAYSSASNGYHGFSVETWWKIAASLKVDLRILIRRNENELQS